MNNCKGCCIINRSQCSMYIYNVYGDCPCTDCLVKVTCENESCQKLRDVIVIISDYRNRRDHDQMLELLRGIE